MGKKGGIREVEEMRNGNMIMRTKETDITDEQHAQAGYELHMAAWAIIEEALEKGDKSILMESREND